MDNNQGSKTNVGKIVGGVLVILFALVGGYANLGRNPVTNLSTITVMVFLIYWGLKLAGVLKASAAKQSTGNRP